MKYPKSFASDNWAPVHPAVMDAISRCNNMDASAYGADEYTEGAIAKFQEYFGKEIDVYFVFNGTGANVVGLKTLMHPHHAVICSKCAHANIHECGAAESIIGSKLITVDSPDGKITPGDVVSCLVGLDDEHYVQPKVVSITQATEYGTVYSIPEIKAISEIAHKHGLYLHMDGARICNAAASIGCSLKNASLGAGVDVLSFGGTKNGMMYGEAVIFANKNLAAETKYIRKQLTQLASKMRFIAAQFTAMLSDDLWLKNAEHANKMARLLSEKLVGIPGVNVTQKVQSNSVFAMIPPSIVQSLQKEFPFYIWDENKTEVRWMCSFDTCEEDINYFVSAIKAALKQQI